MSTHQSPVLALRRAIEQGPATKTALAIEHAAELARLQGYGLTPQNGCGLHQTSLGAADVWIEYEYEPEGGDGWNEPHYSASVSITGVLVNGAMIDIDVISQGVISRWEQEITDAMVDQAEDARISAAEARRDEREAA